MKKVIRLTESDLARIVKRVITENKNPEWVDSLERRLNRAIDINSDRPFTNSPQASVSFNGRYVDIEIKYGDFMTDSDGVGIIMKDKVRRILGEIGEENGIEFKFKSYNMGSYDRAKHAKDSYDSRDFEKDFYTLKFEYEVIEQLSEGSIDQTRHSENKSLKFMQDEIDKIADESYDINDFDEMIEEFYNEFEEELNNLSDSDYRTLEDYIDDVSSNIRMSDYGDKDHYRGW